MGGVLNPVDGIPKHTSRPAAPQVVNPLTRLVDTGTAVYRSRHSDDMKVGPVPPLPLHATNSVAVPRLAVPVAAPNRVVLTLVLPVTRPVA